MRVRSGIRDENVKKIAERMGQQLPEKKATQDNAVWDKLDHLREYLSDTDILEEIMQAMSTEEATENLDFIIQMHDLPMGGAEDDEY